MADEWDFYALRVDDKPASIFVNLGVHAESPSHELQHMAYLRLRMNAPNAEGLSSQAEFDTLLAIENALESKLIGPTIAYVGRCTTNECRDFYFYIRDPQVWDARVEACMGAFPDYQYQSGTREDPGWKSYFNFLYPGARDRNRMRNRRVCELLEEKGDRLVVSREIDHWAYFANVGQMNAYVAEAATSDFKLRNISTVDKGDMPHGAQLWRMDVPSIDLIDEITLLLEETARKYGGSYDGWECAVVV